MPQQLIYTSAPRGIVAGRSGHCTVARSDLMREALMLQLEKLCYYQHLSLSGGQERPIFACRIVDIRGTRFHVLSRIQDAGLDFTGRTNFIAHHLVFTPEEIRQFPTPPVILRDWPGWVKLWTKEPQLLENEDWAELTALAGSTNVPAQTWQRITGDAVNGYGLLEARVGASFRVDDQTDETILELLAESLELLEVRDTRRDFRTAAWNYTFTTSMQEQDNPADFRWRCIHSDNPAANRFATPDVRALSGVPVQAPRCTDEEKAFARQGRQPPRFAKLASDKYEIQEGTSVRLEVMTDGIPTPTVRWFEIERNEAKEMVGKSGAIQILNPEGRAKRYQVQAFNSSGSADSNVVEISIRAPVKLATQPQSTASRGTAASVLSNEDYQEKKERQLRRIEAEKAQEILQKRQQLKKVSVTILTIVLIASALAAVIVLRGRKPPDITLQPTIQTNEDGSMSINVAAGGKKPLTYQWYTNNQLFLSTTNPILRLEKNELSNSASFFVIITNSMGSVTSTVVQRPDITEPTKTPTPNSDRTPTDSTSKSTSQTPDPKKTLHEDNFEKLSPLWNKTSVGKEDKKPSVFLDSSNTFVLTGCGKNIYGQSDNFFFVYQSISNSVEFIARLSGKIDETTARRGLMMRGSTNADAPFAFIGLSQTNIYWVQRQIAGTNCTFTNLPVTPRPVSFKITRKANTFSGAFSTNGTNWTGIGTDEISMTNQNYLVGFAVCSGINKEPVQANFDKVSINGAK